MTMWLSGATSDYACLWYKVHKLYQWDMSKDLDYYNTEMKRTLQELKNLSSSPKKFSCVHRPLIDIELDHAILDELHLMLRITDRLTENLIIEIMEKDGKQDQNQIRNEEKGANLKQFIKTVNELGITFSTWEKKNAVRKGSGSYDWTSLVGSDKKKLMKLLPARLQGYLDILFPETKQTVITLWEDFYSLYNLINSDSNSDGFYLEIFQKAQDFINLFCSLGNVRVGYSRKRVTPYMHSLAYHVPIFLKNYKNFKQFTGQGIEKKNDAKKIYLKKSNKWDAARDVLLLEHRQEALKHFERGERKYDKKDAAYWEDGIIDMRKKRMKASLREPGNNGEPSSNFEESQNIEEAYYKDMTVKTLREAVKSRNIKAKGIARMKKSELNF